MTLDLSTLPGPDNVTLMTLPNGMRAVLRENHASPSVVVDGLVFAGAIADPAGHQGMAAFTASMLERGTENYDFAALSDALESIGADIDFGAGRHTIGFNAKCLTEDLDTVLDLMSEMLASPVFDPVQVERVRGQTVTGLKQREDSTRHRAARRFRELAYGANHPYGRSVDGTPDSVARIERQELVDFYRSRVSPEDGIVAVVGAFDTAQLTELLKKTLGDWQPKVPSQMQEVPDPSPDTEHRDHLEMPGKVQSDLMIGHASLPRAHSDWRPASLGNAVLGVFGLMGRLGENVRDRRGLAYYAYSRLVGGLGPGPWYAAAGVNPANVAEATAAIRDEMVRLREELVPDDELEDVKAYVTGSLPLQLETNEGIAQALEDIVLYDLGLDYLRKFPDEVRQVDAQQVREAAREHLHVDDLKIVVAGPITE